MTMQEIVDLIVSYASIWVPAIVAVFGVIITVVKCMTEVKNYVDQLKDDKDLRDVKNNTAEIVKENRELMRQNKMLLDNITRIKDYTDNKRDES